MLEIFYLTNMWKTWWEYFRAFVEKALESPVTPTPPVELPLPVNPTPMPKVDPIDTLNPDWSVISNARHNVRVICDLVGLTVTQKNILTACVARESGFDNNAQGFNRDKSGVVWSTDWGIVQCNDYFHIGPGKDFPSVVYVLANPEVLVRWMAAYYKKHNNLNPWSSYTSGAYKRYL